MEQVLNNPYRILGVLAGASAKEVTRQTNRLRKYLAAEQEPPADDYSFPALGKLKYVKVYNTIVRTAPARVVFGGVFHFSFTEPICT